MVTSPHFLKSLTSGLPHSFPESSTTIMRDISFPRMAHPKLWLFLDHFSPMRCIFRAHFPPIPGLCPEPSHCTNYLFQAGWLVVNNRNQSSLLKQMEDSKERDLLIYEWQGKSEFQFRKESGVKRVWIAENMTWPLVLGPKITAGNADPRAPSPHH